MYAQEPEHPPPRRQLGEQPGNDTSTCCTDRCTANEESHGNVAPETRREGDAEECDAIRDHKAAANTCHGAEDAQCNEFGRKASPNSERDPDHSAEEQHVLVPVYCAETAARKDEGTLCQTGGKLAYADSVVVKGTHGYDAAIHAALATEG